MKMRSAIVMFSAALTLGLTACPGDSTGPGDQIDLSVAQVNDLIEAIQAVQTVGGAAAPAGIALATESFDETGPCPDGGTVRMVGTYSEPASGDSWTLDFTQTFTNCQSQGPSGVVWTVGGPLSLDENGSYTDDDFSFSTTATIAGTLDVSSSAGEGNCTVNLTITFNYNGTTESGSGQMTGTACGKTISKPLSEL